MTDRATIITSSQAARAFPRLATFLADNTSIAPDVAEQALRIACQDYAGAQEAIDTRAMWKRATDNANASIGVPPEPTLATAEKPAHPWSEQIRNANASIGAV